MSTNTHEEPKPSESVEGEVMPPNEPGRPTIYTPPLVSKLIVAFNNGFNITEACQYSGISRETYYDWLEHQPGFSDKMEEARMMPNRRAKEVVVAAVNDGDVNTAKWLLDRRDPDFKPKGEIEVSPGQKRTEEKLKEFMDDTNDGAYDDAGTDDVGAEPTASASPEGGNEVAPSTPDIS